MCRELKGVPKTMSEYHISHDKQLLDEFFVISRIIKVEVSVSLNFRRPLLGHLNE